MFITYKITCNVTGTYYIGSHKTDNIDDGYMGSGRFIRKSIEEFGVENHTKEILGVFDNRRDSLELEHKLVKEKKALEKNMCLNIANGGNCFDEVNKSRKNIYARTPKTIELNKLAGKKGYQRLKEMKEQDPAFAQQLHNNITKGLKKYYETHSGTFLGKHHTEEAKEKMRASSKGKGVGIRNSQYGTYWITNGYTSMKWSNSRGEIPDGYYRGRKMN